MPELGKPTSRWYPHLAGQVPFAVEEAFTRYYDLLYQHHDCIMAMMEPPAPPDFSVILAFVVNFLNQLPSRDEFFKFMTFEDPANDIVAAVTSDLDEIIRTKTGAYCIAGNRNVAILGTDGKHWDAVEMDSSLATPTTSAGMAYKAQNNKLAHADGVGRVYTSVNNGVTWTARIDSIRTPNQMRYFGMRGEDRWVFPTTSDRVVHSSNDWVTSNEQVIDVGVQQWHDIAFGAFAGTPIWVVIGDGGRLYSSTDFSTWTSRTSGTSDPLIRIKWWDKKGIFVAMGTTAVIISTDGITWRDARMPVIQLTNTLPIALYLTGNNLWATKGTQIHRTIDGDHWVDQFHEPATQGQDNIKLWASPNDDRFICTGSDDKLHTLGFRSFFTDVL